MESLTTSDAVPRLRGARSTRARRSTRASPRCATSATSDGVTLALRDAIAAGTVAGPRIIDAGTGISATSGHGDRTLGSRARHRRARLRDEPVRRAREPAAARCARRSRRGVDVIKIMTTGGVNSRIGAGLGKQMFDDEAQALIETAHLYGKKVAVHAHGADGINLALKHGADSIEHGTLLDDESVKLFLKSGAYYVPTLSTVNGYLERIAKDPNAYPPEVRAKIEWRITITGKALRDRVSARREDRVRHRCRRVEARPQRRRVRADGEARHAGRRGDQGRDASTPPTCSASPREAGSIEPGKRADLIAVARRSAQRRHGAQARVVRDEGRRRAQAPGGAMKAAALALTMVASVAFAARAGRAGRRLRPARISASPPAKRCPSCDCTTERSASCSATRAAWRATPC